MKIAAGNTPHLIKGRFTIISYPDHLCIVEVVDTETLGPLKPIGSIPVFSPRADGEAFLMGLSCLLDYGYITPMEYFHEAEKVLNAMDSEWKFKVLKPDWQDSEGRSLEDILLNAGEEKRPDRTPGRSPEIT